MNQLLAEYCQGFFFLFVPNVCNARCQFCYVAPTYVTSAQLSVVDLRRAETLFRIMRQLGFRNVRLTGGEPGAFRNLPALIKIIQDQGFGYTLLSNGFATNTLAACADVQLPTKVTFSIHSLKGARSAFSVDDYDLGAIEDLTSVFIRREVSVCVTCVALEGMDGHQVDVIDSFYSWGVREFKVVFPNVPETVADRIRRFDDLVETLTACAADRWPAAKIRYSNLAQRECLLRKQGFVAFAMPTFELYKCCVDVGGKDRREIYPDFSNIEAALLRMQEQNYDYLGLPCTTFSGACPIALRGISASISA